MTGGAGFIGRHLRRRLERNGAWEVVSLDLCAGRDGDPIVDLASRESVEHALRDAHISGGAGVVIHLAARLVGPGQERDMSVLHGNLSMAENVVRLAEGVGARKLIHASTMAVYPNRSGVYSETSPTYVADNTECLYGLSKICAEQVLDFLLRPFGCKAVHLRFAQVYGPGMRPDRTPSRMEDELRRTGVVTVFGGGERESNFIAIDRVIDAFELFLGRDAEGVYNVGDEQLTYRALAGSIVARYGDAGARIALVPQGSRAKVVLDCGKYRALAAMKDAIP